MVLHRIVDFDGFIKSTEGNTLIRIGRLVLNVVGVKVQ